MRKIVYAHDDIKADQGLFFGKGLFETILVKEEIEFLEEHIKRLKDSLNIIKLEPLNEENILKDAINNMNLKNTSLKITVTPSYIILTTRDIPYKDSDYKAGFKLKVSHVLRNSTSILPKIKSTCYIENIIEKEKAKEEGFNDCIFLNEKGFITETSAANIFMIKDEKVYTPKIECGLLPGIIRDKIIEKYSVIEKEITLDELKIADHVFLSNSLMKIMNVVSIEEKVYKVKNDLSI